MPTEIDKAKVAADTRLAIIKIGDVMRRKRKEMGLTQQHLAFLMFTDKCLISEIERGQYKNITISTLIKLASVLKIEVKDFF